MSKFYSDRYVKPQTSRMSMNYGNFSNSGKLVETIICVFLGSIVNGIIKVKYLNSSKYLSSYEALNSFKTSS